jgi:hypothetical protein
MQEVAEIIIGPMNRGRRLAPPAGARAEGVRVAAFCQIILLDFRANGHLDYVDTAHPDYVDKHLTRVFR